MKAQLCICILIACAVSCSGETIIVAKDGAGDFTKIQDAIDSSSYGDTIMVMPGTYYESINFHGLAITVTSHDPNDSATIATTILAGNSPYSVTFEFGEDNRSVITGFTITGGGGIKCTSTSPLITKNVIRYLPQPPSSENAAIEGNASSYPEIRYNQILNNECRAIANCHGIIHHNTFSNNTAWLVGGALYACNGTIEYNTIISNIIETGSRGVSGGGALAYCNGTIRYNSVIGNITRGGDYASCYGGGFYKCNGSIRNNIISGNSVLPISFFKIYGYGGGLAQCSGEIINNTIVGNRVFTNSSNIIGMGGGLYQCSGSIKNNIIAFNKADVGGGISGVIHSYCDFWGNLADNFGGGSAGLGDQGVDPLFAINGSWDTNGVWIEGDYHLKSQSGRWVASSQLWIVDVVTSKCIDAGDPCDSIGQEPNPNGGRINIGAYGGTVEASKSPTGIIVPVCTRYSAMDFNKDCKVNFIDFAVFSQSWLECNFDPKDLCWQ